MAAQEAPDNETTRIELQEALISYRHFSAQFTQATGFLVTADVALLSFGFTQKFAVVLLAASVVPMIILLYFTTVGGYINPLINIILRLERSLLIRENSLGAVAARRNFGKMTPDLGRRIEDLTDDEVRHLTFKWDPLRSKIPLALYGGTLAQLVLFVLSLAFFHYRFM